MVRGSLLYSVCVGATLLLPALASAADGAKVLYDSGIALMRQGRPAEAAEAFTMVIKSDPNAWQPFAMRAEANIAQGPGHHHYLNAIADFTRAIDRNPRSGALYQRRVGVCRALSNHAACVNRMRNWAAHGDPVATAVLRQEGQAIAQQPQQFGGGFQQGQAIAQPPQQSGGGFQVFEPTPPPKSAFTPPPGGCWQTHSAAEYGKCVGNLVDPQHKGLNQAQINAMQTEGQLMWNSTNPNMVYH